MERLAPATSLQGERMTASFGIAQQATSGVLVHPGTHTVWLIFHTRPVPKEVPTDVQHARAVYGRDGQLVEWIFSPRSGRDGEPVPLGGAFERFLRWRTQWANDRAIGDAATVWAFVDWADRHVHAPRLPVLRSQLGHVEPKYVPELGWEAKKAAEACKRSHESGVGIISQTTGRVIRGFVPGGSPVIVLADPSAQVVATRDGLLLSQREPVALDEVRVRGWRAANGGIVVTTAEGDIDVGRSSAARLLDQIGVGNASVTVEPVPLTRLFSYLTTSIADIAQLASVARQTLYVRTSEV
jgi:hypothetical protein